MKKRFLGIICFLYAGIIIYSWIFDKLRNFLAPNMQIYLKISVIPIIIIGLVMLLNNRVKYIFKLTDLILFLPIIMLVFAGDGRLTENLSTNRTGFNREKSIKTLPEEKKEEFVELPSEENQKANEEESKTEIIVEQKEIYDFDNPYFNVTDPLYNELANYISYAPNAKKFIDKTIVVRGFSQKYASFIPDGFFTIGKYSVSCCVADSSFIGFFIKYDPELIKNGGWYEIKGILKEGKDKDGYNILYIEVIDINEIDNKKEEQYIYPCYAYDGNKCTELDKYELDY